MEEIVTCSICAQEFESLRIIPKVLECGHTFCSPCVTKLFQKSPNCPNCRAEIKGTESCLPINYEILKVVDIYKSKCWSSREISTSVDVLKKECKKKEEFISKKRNEMTSSLETLVKCLEKLEELTVSECQRTDTVNAKRILSEVEEDLKKINDGMRCDDIKSSVSIFLSNFRDSEEFLTEIYKRVENEEKVFAVHKIGDDVKYGKISVFENKIFFHSLSLSEVPKESSLIWFHELNRCANKENFFTFLKISCNKKNITRVLIIKMIDRSLSNLFTKFCTGEEGFCYKGASFQKEEEDEDYKDILVVQNFIKNGHQSTRVVNYDFSNSKDKFKCEENQFYLFASDTDGYFDIFLAKTTYDQEYIIGSVVSPTNLNDCINYDHSSFLKIVDCGIVFEV